MDIRYRQNNVNINYLTRDVTIASTKFTDIAATGRHLIDRHHGLRRYNLVDSPINTPKARLDGKTRHANETYCHWLYIYIYIFF